MVSNEIPIDNYIVDFDKYLLNSSRGIFSASFGDGKTYMLDKFRKEKSNDYTFITLYPVHYQTASNADIFELIKRDILIQLFQQNILNLEEYPEIIEDKHLLKEVVKQFEAFADLGIIVTSVTSSSPEEAAAWGAGISAGKKLLEVGSHLFDAWNIKKKDTDKEDSQSRFLNSFQEKSGSIYEFDAISNLISKSIMNVDDKKTVLVIEDLDRLDPAHTFRILNILSAHIDYQFVHTSGVEGNRLASVNKFGFDKTVLVCDIDKLKSIYHHFYGSDTDFHGYISKFTTELPFRYSFRNVVRQYLYDYLTNVIQCSRADLPSMINVAYSDTKEGWNYTARCVLNAIERVSKTCPDNRVKISDRLEFPLDETPLAFYIVLKQLGYNAKGMGEVIFNILKTASSFEKVAQYIGQLLLLVFEEEELDSDNKIFQELILRFESNVNTNILGTFTIRLTNGKVSLERYMSQGLHSKMIRPHELGLKIFDMIH